MTLVASWISLEKGAQRSIWVAADTKISSRNTALTLEGAKVLELQIACRSLSHDWGTVVYRTSLCFAYAGSSLVALNSYAALSTILSNLGAGGGSLARPSAFSILEAAEKILKLYCVEIRDLAHLTISGFCPKTNKPFIGTIKSKEGLSTIECDINIVEQSDTLNTVLIGSHVELIRERIDKLASLSTDRSSYKYWRTPITVLNQLIVDEEYSEIGGNIQLAIVGESYGFRHHAFANDKNNNKLLYRNIDIDEIIGMRVGECIIAIAGLDMKI